MEHKTRVILITGKAGAGKDAAGQAMQEILEAVGKRVLMTHYADLLKYICREFFHWDGKKDGYGRGLLQHVGTDVVRAQNPSYWVNFLISIVRMFPDRWDVVIIPDCRFPNEVTRWRKYDIPTTLVRVERPAGNPKGFWQRLKNAAGRFVGTRNAELHTMTAAQAAHISETAMDDFPADLTIQNDGTLQDLRASAGSAALRLCGLLDAHH